MKCTRPHPENALKLGSALKKYFSDVTSVTFTILSFFSVPIFIYTNATTIIDECCCKEHFCLCFLLVRTEFCYSLFYNFTFNNLNNLAFIQFEKTHWFPLVLAMFTSYRIVFCSVSQNYVNHETFRRYFRSKFCLWPKVYHT